MTSLFRLFPIAGLAVVGACASAEPAGEPHLIEVGMVVLEEEGTAGLVRFGPDGLFIRQYGRQGDGPGEYRMPVAPHVTDDSTVIVSDVPRTSLNAFNRRDGSFRERQEGIGTVMSTHSSRGDILLGMIVPPMDIVVRRIGGMTDSVRHVAVLPTQPMEVLQQSGSMLQALILVRGDTLLAGAGLSNQLLVLVGDLVIDTLDIPVARRRGVPADLATRFAESPQSDRIMLYSSQVWALDLGEQVGLVHFDVTQVAPRPSMAGFRMEMATWLTVLSADLATACVDLPIPLAGDMHPFATSRGDTLLVLDHHDTGSDIQTVVRKYLVDTDRCDWQPVRRGRVGPG